MKKLVVIVAVFASLLVVSASQAEAGCGLGRRVGKGAKWLKNHIPIVRRIGHG